MAEWHIQSFIHWWHPNTTSKSNMASICLQMNKRDCTAFTSVSFTFDLHHSTCTLPLLISFTSNLWPQVVCHNIDLWGHTAKSLQAWCTKVLAKVVYYEHNGMLKDEEIKADVWFYKEDTPGLYYLKYTHALLGIECALWLLKI